MASSESTDKSNNMSAPTLSGRTPARFGVGSPDGNDAVAMPSLVKSNTGERIPLMDGDAVEGSEMTRTPALSQML